MEYNGNPLFNEPVVNQYGSHMVMTGVSVPPKKKYYNIDTRFRDDYDSVSNSSIVITLPQRITKVKSLKVTNAEIPFSYYNVSSALNNNTILFTDNLGVQTVYTIADGFYSANSTNTIANYFSSHTINSYITYSAYNTNSSRFVFTPSGGVTSMTMQFAVSSTGNFDKLELKNKIGWMLGFRLASYTFTAAKTTIASEAFLDMNGFKYLFLVLDEFTQNTNDNTFVSPLYRSIINKNILCRMNTSLFPLSSYKFADTIFTPNEKDGTLLSDKRTYNSVDLQKLRVELVNEFGNSVHLNGLDFSFCLEIECV
jgi:hypothetical protein